MIRDAVEAAGEDFEGFVDHGVGAGGRKLGGGEAHKLRELVDQGGERGDFAFDQAGALLNETREFCIARSGDFVGIAAIEEARKALRGKLDRREWILDFVSNAAGDFLPGGGFLRAENFGQVVENEDETGVGAARAEGTDGNGKMQDAARDDGFNFARDDAHAQAAAHQELHGARGFRADHVFERLNVSGRTAEHAGDRSIFTKDGAVGVQGNYAGGNVLENGFHQLAASFEFLNGLLEIAGELIDLSAGIAQLRGHGVEGANKNAEFVLRLFGNLIVEIAGGDFASAFGEGLNGNGDLLGQEQGNPHEREEKEHGEETENQEHLALEGAQVLLLFVVFLAVRLDFREARQKIGAGEITRGDVTDGAAFVDGGNPRDQIGSSLRGPKLQFQTEACEQESPKRRHVRKSGRCDLRADRRRATPPRTSLPSLSRIQSASRPD